MGEEGHFISNGEKVPKGIKKEYKRILELAQTCREKIGAIGADGLELLKVLDTAPRGIKGKKVFQIRDMVENIANVKEKMSSALAKHSYDNDFQELDRRLKCLEETIQHREAKGGPLEERLGNEVMMNLDEVL